MTDELTINILRVRVHDPVPYSELWFQRESILQNVKSVAVAVVVAVAAVGSLRFQRLRTEPVGTDD
jgi:hypothetical protein